MNLVEMMVDGRLNEPTATNASCSKVLAVRGQRTMRTVEVVKRDYHYVDLTQQMMVPRTLDALEEDQVDCPRDNDAHGHCHSNS